jgi:hypothetical protein
VRRHEQRVNAEWRFIMYFAAANYGNEKKSFESALFDPLQKNSIAEMIEKTASRAQSRQRCSGACIPLCCCKAV